MSQDCENCQRLKVTNELAVERIVELQRQLRDKKYRVKSAKELLKTLKYSVDQAILKMKEEDE